MEPMTPSSSSRDRPGWSWTALVAATLSAFVLAGCDDPAPVKIGFIGGLSGRSSDIGEASRNAVQLAVIEVNQHGGIDGHPIELLVRDDANSPATAEAAVRDLYAAGVSAIIGPNVSVIASGMLPAINELKIVTVSPTVSSLAFADLDDFLFRINWTTRDNARIYARHYFDRGVRRVAAAIDIRNRVFSESWLNEFAAAFAGIGGTIVASDLFDATSERGYSATAERLLAGDAEAILLIANSVDTAQMAHQIRKLDDRILLIAAEWAASERLLVLGGSAIEGLELVQSYDRTDASDRFVRFQDAFRKQFQQDPDYSSIAAYDAATVIFRAMHDRGDDQSLKDALIALPAVQGLQQAIKFNRFGDAERQAFFVVVRDGGFRPL